MKKILKFHKHVETLLSAQGFTNKGMSEFDGKLLHCALLVSEEAGELISPIKSHFAYGKGLDVENILEECGDLLFSMTGILNHVGCNLDDAMEYNYRKLAKRYPKGFNFQDAVARKDKQEGGV